MIVIKQSITFISQRIARNANCKHCIYSIITRRRSFAEYWKYSVARFNDVHAFGYNSAGSERIWMKFGELPSILFGAGPDRFWARSTQNRERETLWKFCFFLSGKQRTTLPISVSQISRNLHTSRGSVRW